MLGSAVWLTLATLLGLCLGFAREWLLVAAWGAGERSDAFLIALFLPEALRMSLAGGVLSAAALPLYLQRKDSERLDWLAVLFPALLLVALLVSLLLMLSAPWLVQVLGPGLATSATALAQQFAGRGLVRARLDAACTVQYSLAGQRAFCAGRARLVVVQPAAGGLSRVGRHGQSTP